jgi:tight adherence protein B
MLAFILTAGFFLVIFLVAFIAVLVATEVMDRRAGLEGLAAGAAAGADGGSTIMREDNVSSISPLAAILKNIDFVRIVQTTTLQAGLDWPVGRTVAMMLLCGTLALALCATDWMPTLFLLAIAAFSSAIPYLYILRMRRKRFQDFEAQLPEAIDSLCRALKAGHPFAAGMEVIANEDFEPVSSEMQRALDEWKLGMTWMQALESLTVRVPLTDLQVFVSAVKLHMRTGGRLGEVLGRLAETMRENTSIRGEVRSLAAHGRMTGVILSFLPIALAIVMFMVNPSLMLMLVTHPLGQKLIIGAVVCLLLAHVIIRKIVDIRMQ